MSKRLSEMTLEELWQLFPIYLVKHREEWKAWYAETERELKSILPYAVFHHIGSTAIDGICAKDIVDILAETDGDMDKDASALAERGWVCMSRGESRRSFNRGYTENGFDERVYHLHLRRPGDRDEVYFRDYMNAHPGAAQEYEALKLSLWKKYTHDRDGYTAAKTAFVKKYTTMAKIRFEIIANADFPAYEGTLFDILYENMQKIAPAQGDFSEEFEAWRRAVGDGMKRPARRIILIRCAEEIVGFFQYYVFADTFMMEEIQIKEEYRTDYGIFRSLYGFLLPQLPEDITYVKAFADVRNERSDAILRRLGLSPTDEKAPEGIHAYCGKYRELLNWHAKSRS